MLTDSLKGVLSEGVSVELQACLAEEYDARIDQTYVPCDQPHVSQELFVAPAIGTRDEAFPGDVVPAGDPSVQRDRVGRRRDHEGSQRRRLLSRERQRLVDGRAQR